MLKVRERWGAAAEKGCWTTADRNVKAEFISISTESASGFYLIKSKSHHTHSWSIPMRLVIKQLLPILYTISQQWAVLRVAAQLQIQPESPWGRSAASTLRKIGRQFALVNPQNSNAKEGRPWKLCARSSWMCKQSVPDGVVLIHPSESEQYVCAESGHIVLRHIFSSPIPKQQLSLAWHFHHWPLREHKTYALEKINLLAAAKCSCLYYPWISLSPNKGYEAIRAPPTNKAHHSGINGKGATRDIGELLNNSISTCLLLKESFILKILLC